METFTLNELKVAVINENLDKLKELSAKTPDFSSLEEAKEFVSYIQKAIEILQKEKNHLSKEMSEIRKLKHFYQNQQKTTYDVKG